MAAGVDLCSVSDLDVLILDHEPISGQATARLLLPLRVEVVHSMAEAKKLLDSCEPRALVCDYFLQRGETTGELLAFVREKWPAVRLVIYSAYRDPAVTTVLATGLAHALVTKPAGRDELLAAIQGL